MADKEEEQDDITKLNWDRELSRSQLKEILMDIQINVNNILRDNVKLRDELTELTTEFNNPLRPIVDYTGSIGYSTSRALADLLGPLVGTTKHHVKNSRELAEELSSVTIDQEDIFNSHDVV